MKNYEEKKKIQQDYYNSTAEQYDEWHLEPRSGQIVDAQNFELLKKFIGQAKVEKCLDVACGTGRLTSKLMQVSDYVYGVDASEKVLNIAKEKYPTLNLQLGESVALPYEDNAFDLVVVNGSLHHFFALEKTFEEVFRVLKSGGKFSILGEPNKNYLKWWNPCFWFFVASRILSKLIHVFKKTKAVPSEMIEPEAENYVPHEFKKALQKAGFDVEGFYTYDYFPRNEWRIWLKIYSRYLKFEKKYLTKILPKWGAAIGAMCSKK